MPHAAVPRLSIQGWSKVQTEHSSLSHPSPHVSAGRGTPRSILKRTTPRGQVGAPSPRCRATPRGQWPTLLNQPYGDRSKSRADVSEVDERGAAFSHRLAKSVAEAVTIRGASLEDEVTLWLEIISGEQRNDGGFAEWLRNGRVLCASANGVWPGICGKRKGKGTDKIATFLGACLALGVPKRSLLRAEDLLDSGDVQRLQLCVVALAGVARRSVPQFRGPYLGPVVQSGSLVEECWVVVFDGVVNNRAKRTRESWVLAEIPHGTRLRGRRRRDDWLELSDRGGFVMIRCDGVEVMRQQALVTITLGKRPGMLPGIKWTTTPIGMQVETAGDGLVDVWNTANPDQSIDVGDHIIDVNGVSDRDAIRTEWLTKHVFAVRVLKPAIALRN